MIKLVLCDLDGTLLPQGAPHVPEKTLAAIDRLQDGGVRFAPCSGRPLSCLDWMFSHAADSITSAVLVNGQVVILDGAIAYKKELDAKALEQLSQFVLAFDKTALVVDLDNHEYAVGVDQRLIDSNADVFGGHPSAMENFPKRPIVKSLIYAGGSPEQVEQTRAACEHSFPAFDFVLPAPNQPVIDVLPRGWNKSSGAKKLQELLEVDSSEVCVFGNAENDIPLLKSFDNFAAVDDSTNLIHKMANHHIGACSRQGVAAALDEIISANKEERAPSFLL